MTCDDTPMTPAERAITGITCLIGAAVIWCCCVMCAGCHAFYENAGAHVRTGSITAPIEVSEPTSSINVRALYAMDGIDFYAAKNCNVKMWYTNDYTNTYFGIVETRGRQSSRVEIEPTETTSSGEAEAGNR